MPFFSNNQMLPLFYKYKILQNFILFTFSVTKLLMKKKKHFASLREWGLLRVAQKLAPRHSA
jgi:hypothetical protein